MPIFIVSLLAVYRCAIGNFNSIFGLNATGENVAYFITGAPPPRRVYAYNWLRIAPYLPDLYPVVKGIKKERPLFKQQVFITDESLGWHYLHYLCYISRILLTITNSFFF